MAKKLPVVVFKPPLSPAKTMPYIVSLAVSIIGMLFIDLGWLRLAWVVLFAFTALMLLIDLTNKYQLLSAKLVIKHNLVLSEEIKLWDVIDVDSYTGELPKNPAPDQFVLDKSHKGETVFIELSSEAGKKKYYLPVTGAQAVVEKIKDRILRNA